MIEVKRTEQFDHWLKGLADPLARAKCLVRIDRLKGGNPGDVKPAGNGVTEMRIDYGPGYRMYYAQVDGVMILCGGDKSSQDRDIKVAHAIVDQLKNAAAKAAAPVEAFAAAKAKGKKR
jgi:putative addiction module killer protein